MKARVGCWLVATVVLATLAGCGDDEGDSSAAETTTTTAAVTTTLPGAAAQVATVKFLEPVDGAKVTGLVKVRMEATGFTIEPAGEVKPAAGHFHIIVDGDCVAVGGVIPKDDKNLHYGMAQTEAELTLAAGRHTLCLQAGDGAHQALDLTDKVTIEVQNTGY
ncbi:MAG: DUF4399 domain-containing protein [Acidimicrobiia bacterium]